MTKFTPTPEMMDEMVEAAYKAYAHDRRPGVRGQLVTSNDDPMYRAVSAALTLAIPMIAEECAKIFDAKAAVHGAQAEWIGEHREYYKGERIPGVALSPMNGPAIAYDRERANADAIRAKFSAP